MTDYMQRDGDTLRYNTADRYYTFTPVVFIKRQAKAHEVRYRQMDGKVVEHAFNRQRIENERDAITFISKNTSIPVPRLIEWTDEDGVGCLTYELLKGQTFGELYWELDPEGQERMGNNLIVFIKGTLLPELSRLRSKTMGQLSGIVFPPPRVTSCDNRPEWESRTSSTDRYVYCHNDLDLHNFMFNKETLDVEAVIDWEYSGFFPPEMEFPFWDEGKEASLEEGHCREMIALLDAPGDPPYSDDPPTSVASFFRFFYSLLAWLRIKSSPILSMVYCSLQFRHSLD